MSAVRPEQFPREELPEFAFLGRSNVGKSSLLNALVRQKGLAHTSSTPGRTQAINFFRVEEKWTFVDLPGYGYARVPKEITATWKFLIEEYLKNRQGLSLCFLLLDARRGWMEMDADLRKWLQSWGRPYAVVATKVDKLKTQKERHSLTKLMAEDGAPFIPFSAITGQGVREIWQTISRTNHQT
jgi:GTP-binding protein